VFFCFFFLFYAGFRSGDTSLKFRFYPYSPQFRQRCSISRHVHPLSSTRVRLIFDYLSNPLKIDYLERKLRNKFLVSELFYILAKNSVLLCLPSSSEFYRHQRLSLITLVLDPEVVSQFGSLFDDAWNAIIACE